MAQPRFGRTCSCNPPGDSSRRLGSERETRRRGSRFDAIVTLDQTRDLMKASPSRHRPIGSGNRSRQTLRGRGQGGQCPAERLDGQIAVVPALLRARWKKPSQWTCPVPGIPRSFSETWTWIVSAAHDAIACAWSFSSMCAWKLSYIILQ